MLYFEHKISEIQAYIDSKLASEQEANAKPESEAEDLITSTKKIKKVTLGQPITTTSPKTKSKRPYKHSSFNDARKKEIGNKSERDVYLYLVEEYGQNKVTWISKADDGYGCDLKYINELGITIYVEVKTFSGNRFYISKNEIEFSRKNFGQYEIFLVGDDILKITDVDFDNKSQFRLESQDFLVSYNIV
jgi:hypothetical protein